MILCLCPNPSIDKFIWFEGFKAGNVNRVKKEVSFPGGKGVHVALGVAELGEECAILGFWGSDGGKWIKKNCENRGISCYGPEVDEPARTCLTFRSDDEFDSTEILEFGPAVGGNEVDLFRLEFKRLLRKVSAICMSGSWPQTKEEIGYSEFVVLAKEEGVKSFVDCSGDNLLSVLSANPYGVHINQEEGMEVFNYDTPLKIADEVSKKCDLAAITCGAAGLYLSNSKTTLHGNCKLGQIISTIGCGDSLMAGLIVAHVRNLNLVDTAKISVACGAANCLREDLGMFYKRDVERLMKESMITDIH